MKTYFSPIIIEQDNDGYVASCPTLQGCYTQGDTYEATMGNIIDAIQLHVEDRKAEDDEIPFPRTVSVSTVAITV